MNTQEALQILGLKGNVKKADIKKAYKQKAKEFHPDKNSAGNEMMKLINAAYDVVKSLNSASVEENENLSEYPESIQNAINALFGINLDIEVCGLWLWVSGDTFKHKETLKSAGFRWSSKKKMWYFRPENMKKTYNKGKTFSIDEIRILHGARKVQPTQFKTLKSA